MPVLDLIRDVIKKNQLPDWLADCPWLTGYLGDPMSPVWFIGENPSLGRVKIIDRRSIEKSENLQWSCEFRECRLFRQALTEAGLKSGAPELDEGWKCYITNVVKEPEVVNVRNRHKNTQKYWMDQAKTWLDVLQYQIDNGAPRVLVAIGGEAEKILRYLRRAGLNGPHIERIPHYSYVMLRPESSPPRRGPGHPERQAEFKKRIGEIAEKYGC
jgi:hypothetical protein